MEPEPKPAPSATVEAQIPVAPTRRPIAPSRAPGGAAAKFFVSVGALFCAAFLYARVTGAFKVEGRLKIGKELTNYQDAKAAAEALKASDASSTGQMR